MRNTYFIFFAIILFSCKKIEENPFYENATIQFKDENFSNIGRLKAKVLVQFSDSLLRPTTLHLVDSDYLVVSEAKSNIAMHVVKVPDDVYLGSFGKKGNGPGEIIVPWKFFNSDDGRFGIFDIEQRKAVEFVVDSLLESNSFIYEYKLGAGVRSNGVVLHDNKIFFTDANNLEGRLFSTELDGSNLISYGKLPDISINYPKISFEEVMEASGLTKLVNLGNKFVLSYYNIPLIEIFDYVNNSWTSITGPDLLPLSQSLEKTIFFGSVFISDQYIYALYFGRDDSYATPSNLLYVFNHQGEVVKKLELDERIFEFVVFENNFLYGLARDVKSLDYAVIKFELK